MAAPIPASAPPSEFAEALARAHRALFVRNQKRIAAQLGPQSALFERYERRYLRHSRTAAVPIAKEALEREVARARWLFVGDYHTLAESRAQFLALIAPLAAAQAHAHAQLVVALEYFATPDQAALDGYMRGTLGEDELRRRTHRAGRLATGDAAWHSYVPLLRWAKRHRVALVALDAPRRGGASLPERDRHAARVLAALRRRLPRAQICVLAGQLHVTPGHLPHAVAQALLARSELSAKRAAQPIAQPLAQLDAVSIYQNSEAAFLSQLRRGQLPLGEALRLTRRSFVLMHTAPIAAQHTFLRALEAGREEQQAHDVGEQLAEAARQAAGLLGYVLPDGLDAWEALPFGRRGSVLRQLGRHKLTQEEMRALIVRLRRGLPAWLPRAQRLWIPHQLLGEVPHVSLAGTLLWLHAQTPGRVRRASAAARLHIALGETLAAATGILCAQLLHPAVLRPSNTQLRRRPAHGDALGHALGYALADGLLRGRIGPAQILGLFAPPPPSMARFAQWPKLAGLPPRQWQNLVPQGL